MDRVADQLLEKIIKAFPDQVSVSKHNNLLKVKNRAKFIYGSSEDETEVEDGSNDELQGVIDAICASNNTYNEIL